MEYLESFIQVFGLVFLAEFGDKSQLVCMTLAVRYRASIVVIGSVTAFMLLNLLAVLFGVAAAELISDRVIYLLVGILFGWFGWQMFSTPPEDESIDPKVGTRLLLSVFILIFLAELGDKTQLSLAVLAAVEPPFSVWMAGTSALVCTTLLGVWLGGTVLQKISIVWVHRGAGVLFVMFSGIAFWRLYSTVS